MRIMTVSACKPDASKTRLENQGFHGKPPNPADSIWAIGASNCMQLRRSIVAQL
jgi:hypothetical protein